MSRAIEEKFQMESEKIDTFVTQGLNVAFNTEIFVSHEREKWIIFPIIDGKGYSAFIYGASHAFICSTR